MAVDPTTGKQFGNYILGALLGRGGMGSVYAARHRFLGDRVAIKMLHGNFAEHAQIVERFFQEAKASREIAHPNVVKIIDFGESPDGGLYLVMELLPGASLGDVLRQGPLDEAVVAGIGWRVAEGLAAAHEKGIIHRDLKPGNILLTGEGAKVVDFGIAKVSSANSNTATSAVLGTPRYMAPEQATSARHVEARSDVYALGVVLYRCLTLRYPFDADTPAELLGQMFFQPPTPPSRYRAISAPMEAVIMSCLEKEIDKRPASMSVLAASLRALDPQGSFPDSLRERVVKASPAPEPDELGSTLGGSAGESVSRPRAAKKPVAPGIEAMAPAAVLPEAAAKVEPPVAVVAPPPRKPLRIAAALLVVGALGIAGAAIYLSRRAPTAAGRPIAVSAPRPLAMPGDAADRATALVAPSAAKVVVRSLPTGAEVKIDGRAVGVTPCVVNAILPQQIEITLDKHKPIREVLTRADEVTFTFERLATGAARPDARKAPGKPALEGGLD